MGIHEIDKTLQTLASLVEADDPKLEAARKRAAELAARDNKRQVIYITPTGEYRIRPYGEKTNPGNGWKFIEHYPDDDMPKGSVTAHAERSDIVAGMAKALFSTAWADDQEERHRSSGKKGLSPLSGQEITKIAPAPSASAKNAAAALAKQYEKKNGKGLDALYADAKKANGGQAADAEKFGHYLAMMALGHGVSWFDDHKKFPLERVHTEFHL